MKVNDTHISILRKIWTLEIQHTVYDAQKQSFSIDYDKLRFLVKEYDNNTISESITIVNPISGYQCKFDLLHYQGDDNTNPSYDRLQLKPNEVARYGAWYKHGDGDSLYYEISVTKPVAQAIDHEWIDISEQFENIWKPYIPAGIDPYQEYVDADDIGKVYNGNSTLDADMMMKIAEWYSRVK